MVKITREEFARVLDEYGLWSFPRYVGTPKQVLLGSPAGFFPWFDAAQKAPEPAYAAHNGLVPAKEGQVPSRKKLRFRSAFGDFDTDFGARPEEVFADIQNISRFCQAERLPHGFVYSGNLREGKAGFHAYVRFQEEDRHIDYLNRWEPAFWRGLTSHLRLKSINERCADPGRIARIPFSRYVSQTDAGEKFVGDNYCVPIPWDRIETSTLSSIQAQSRHPTLTESYFFQAQLQPLESFVKKFRWQTFGPETATLHPEPRNLPVGPTRDLMRRYEPTRLCLQELLFETRPRHVVRVAACVALTHIKPAFTLPELQDFFDRVSEEAQWIDRQNAGDRHMHVAQIWRRAAEGNPYVIHSCATLRQAGACLGARCQRFAQEFPNEAKP
jgi:hypothetical protein